MGKVVVRMNSNGARELLNSREVMDDLLSRAERVKDSADSVSHAKYSADVMAGRNRAHAMVKTTNHESMASNAKHNTLLKSLDAGR